MQCPCSNPSTTHDNEIENSVHIPALRVKALGAGFIILRWGGALNQMELNKIYNEDCITGMDRLPDGSVDMILTDMPYGITACEWDVMPPLDKLWRQFERVIEDNGAIVLTSCQPFTTSLINSNPKWFRYCWYWIKNTATGFANSHKMPLKCVEEVCVFYKHLPVYNPQGLIKLDKPQKHKGRERKYNIPCP